jgi:molybdate transport system substrate-binding protein
VVLTVPEAEGPRVLYPMAALSKGKASEAGRAFVRFLQGEAARSVFEKYGFLFLPKKTQP